MNSYLQNFLDSKEAIYHTVSVFKNNQLFFAGLIDDKDFSIDSRTEMQTSNSTGIVSNIADKAYETLEKFGFDKAASLVNGIKSTASSLKEKAENAGAVFLGDTINMPKSFASPDISFTCTFFKGLKVRSHERDYFAVTSYRDFMCDIVSLLYPESKVDNAFMDGALVSPQLDSKLLLKLVGAKTITTSKTTAQEVREHLFQIRMGNFFERSGYWLTGVKVSSVHSYDDNGEPLIWTCDFSFQYYAQMTRDEFVSSWQ